MRNNDYGWRTSYGSYNSSHACSINDGDSVVITGGAGEGSITVSPRVTRYNKDGWLEDMPELNIASDSSNLPGRKDHACGGFYNSLEERVHSRYY